MEARVKKSERWNVMQSAGLEFVKDEYRPVPEIAEAEILANPHLEVKGKASKAAAPAAADKPPTVKAMKAMAKAAGVKGYSKMKADELIAILEL